jgi:hypothetical protein
MPFEDQRYRCPACNHGIPARPNGPWWSGDRVDCRRCKIRLRFEQVRPSERVRLRLRAVADDDARPAMGDCA